MIRGVFRAGLSALVITAAVASGYWAATSDSAQKSYDVDSEPLTVTARFGTLGETYSLPVDVTWPDGHAYEYLGPSGVLTSLAARPGISNIVGSGEVLLTVDARPVVLLEGHVPAYRRMEFGDSGADVTQLQQHLRKRGDLTVDVDGEFGSATAHAVEAWMESVGISGTRHVPLGMVVFAPNLPRHVELPKVFSLGSTLQSGAPIVSLSATVPVVTVRLTPLQQSRYLAAEARFMVSVDGREIPLVLGDEGSALVLTDSGDAVLRLSPVGRSDVVALGTPSIDARLPGVMTVVTPEEGVIVPLEALASRGKARDDVVEHVDGKSSRVTVLAVVGGEAVVEGIDQGAILVLSP